MVRLGFSSGVWLTGLSLDIRERAWRGQKALSRRKADSILGLVKLSVQGRESGRVGDTCGEGQGVGDVLLHGFSASNRLETMSSASVRI